MNKKTSTPKPRATKRGTPVPMPKGLGRIASGALKTPRAVTPKPKTTKKAATPKPKSTLGPLPKKPTLNDYLIRGMKPPVQGRKKLPSDADVRLRGYNS